MSKNKEADTQFDDDFEADDAASGEIEDSDSDFEDGDGGAEDLSDDEDWESYDDENPGAEEGAEEKPAGKKKSSNFNLIVITVAVLGGGAFFLMQMAGGGKPAPQQAAQQQSAPQQAAQDQAKAPAPTPGAPPTPLDFVYGNTTSQAAQDKIDDSGKDQGFLNDPAAMDALEAIQNRVSKAETAEAAPDEAGALPMPAPMTQAEPAVLTPLPEMPATAPETPSPAPAPVPAATAEEAPVSAGLPKADDIVLNKAPAAEEPIAPVIVQQADTSALEAKLDRIAGQLETIENRLNKAEREASAWKEDARAIRASVAAVEKRLNSQPAPKAAAPAETVEKPAAKPPEKPAAKPAAKSAPAPTAAATAKAPTTDGSAAAWVLKSAMPGQAMVARKGGGEVFTVVTGGVLPGVGTITSITPENGRWVVRGTQGAITQ